MADDDIFLESVQRFNATRDLTDRPFYSVCYAPFISLYFDQMGSVRACCQNTKHIVGNITRQSLDEIWHGAAIKQLRESLQINELRNGCQFCEWQFLDGSHDGTFIKRFDPIVAESPSPPFPRMMEFSISNTCNLECVMCNGEWSSLIRTRREKKPPLPKPYDDRFFEDLTKYLPHLQRANFFGGEPFLARETNRIFDLMTELRVSARCHATTNATVYNDRVERILESLTFDLAISCDGVTQETAEAIRKNLDFKSWMENFKRLREYTRRRGTSLGLSHCLMLPNWHEFGDFLLFADDWDCDVWVNIVTHPIHVSLYQLSVSELEQIVARLDERDAFYREKLKRNRHVWEEETNRLRQRLTHFDQQRSFHSWGYRFHRMRNDSTPFLNQERVTEIMREWSGRGPVVSVSCGASEVIDEINVFDPDRVDLNWEESLGNHISSMQPLLSQRFGWHSTLTSYDHDDARIDIVQSFGTVDRPRMEVRALVLPNYGEELALVGTTTYLGMREIASPDIVTIASKVDN